MNDIFRPLKISIVRKKVDADLRHFRHKYLLSALKVTFWAQVCRFIVFSTVRNGEKFVIFDWLLTFETHYVIKRNFFFVGRKNGRTKETENFPTRLFQNRIYLIDNNQRLATTTVVSVATWHHFKSIKNQKIKEINYNSKAKLVCFRANWNKRLKIIEMNY